MNVNCLPPTLLQSDALSTATRIDWPCQSVKANNKRLGLCSQLIEYTGHSLLTNSAKSGQFLTHIVGPYNPTILSLVCWLYSNEVIHTGTRGETVIVQIAHQLEYPFLWVFFI